MSRRQRDGGSSGSEVFVTTLRNFDRVKKKAPQATKKKLTAVYLKNGNEGYTADEAIQAYQKIPKNEHF